MIRVVADTNVYISALNFGGEVLSLARAGDIALFVSPPLIDQVEGVLLGKFRWSARRTREALAGLRKFTHLVHPKEKITAIKEDDPDNRVLDCAVEPRADLIVSGDKKHLLKIRTFRGMAIRGPGEFLELRRRP